MTIQQRMLKNRILVNCRRQFEDGPEYGWIPAACRKQSETNAANDQILPDEPDERVNESVINEQKMIEQSCQTAESFGKADGTAKRRQTMIKTDDKWAAIFDDQKSAWRIQENNGMDPKRGKERFQKRMDVR